MNGSIIDSIYYEVSNTPNIRIAEDKETDKLQQKFLEEQSIDDNSELGIAITEFALDYSCVSREYGFKEGFCLGIKLMIEVLNNE